MTSKEKAQDALPLKGLLKDSEPKRFSNLTEIIGTPKERRECAVGVRVTRDMKDSLEKLSARLRLSESEIVYRILKTHLTTGE